MIKEQIAASFPPEDVELIEYYENGELVKKTLNGVEIPTNVELIPNIMMFREVITLEEAKKRYAEYDL